MCYVSYDFIVFWGSSSEFGFLASSEAGKSCFELYDDNNPTAYIVPWSRIGAPTMVAPTISAVQAVGEYLQSPDDLMKIPAFRKKLEKEKASIDIRLKSGVKEQLAVTSESLRKLFSTRDNV